MARSTPREPDLELQASRRRLMVDSLGIVGSATGFGLVYGLTARAAGFSPLEVGAMGLFAWMFITGRGMNGPVPPAILIAAIQ